MKRSTRDGLRRMAEMLAPHSKQDRAQRSGATPSRSATA